MLVKDKMEIKRISKIIEEELDNVGNDYGWCGCCGQGIDSRDRMCESCLEFARHLVERTKKEMRKAGVQKR